MNTTAQPVVILQARVSSTRLPGKVLLPINGIPLAVLCAKRLASTGLRVVVATSRDISDRPLIDLLKRFDIPFYLGSLEDVLERFVEATAELNGQQIVVRATADNPVPDGHFITDLVTLHTEEDAIYTTTCSPKDGLPYGLSAEAMRVHLLREAHQSTSNSKDREHVTKWIRRTCEPRYIDRHYWGIPDTSHLRCTIDTIDDYHRMHQVFSSLDGDPATTPWLDIVAALIKSSESRSNCLPSPRLKSQANAEMSLGTAQLGLPYGINNTTGQPSVAESIRIVRNAINHGVTWIDTARAYGDSERRVGTAVKGPWGSHARIITKLPASPSFFPHISTALLQEWVDSNIYKSLHSLEVKRLDVVMLHDWNDYHRHNKTLWKRLLDLRSSGVIDCLGVSVKTPSEALEAISDLDIQHIQIPFNLVDRRWLSPSIQRALTCRDDLMVHVRSVFLQGLLLSNGDWWPTNNCGAALYLGIIDDLVRKLRRLNRVDLCIAYVRAYDWVTSIVIGVDTHEQLMTNIRLFSHQAPLTRAEIDLVHSQLKGGPDDLIDPQKWPRKTAFA